MPKGAMPTSMPEVRATDRELLDHSNHHVMAMFGPRLRSGVIGGVEAVGGRATARSRRFRSIGSPAKPRPMARSCSRTRSPRPRPR